MFVHIVAIIRESKYRPLISRLYEENVRGVSVSPLKGYGEHVDTYASDLLENGIKVEIFAAEKNADRISWLIMQEASTGLEGDGIVAVYPVQKIFRIRDTKELNSEDLLI